MSKLTQGTQIYVLDPSDDSVLAIECATNFNPGGNPKAQIEDTCLESAARTYKPGMATPGQATITINADPTNASHIRLFELSQSSDEADQNLQFAVGWSDGVAPPTVDSNGNFNFPATRTWFAFGGYVSDFPFDFALNAVVTSQVTVQRSGPAQWIPKA